MTRKLELNTLTLYCKIGLMPYAINTAIKQRQLVGLIKLITMQCSQSIVEKLAREIKQNYSACEYLKQYSKTNNNLN